MVGAYFRRGGGAKRSLSWGFLLAVFEDEIRLRL